MAIQDRIYTISEFEALEAANDDQLLELINGKVVEKVPTHQRSRIVVALIKLLVAYLNTKEIGRLLTRASYRMPGDDHNARIPDLSFVPTDKIWREKTPAPFMPPLAIEVQSPNQSEKSLHDKAHYYITNGSQLVWIILMEKRTVIVHTPTGQHTLTIDDTLSGTDVLPGLKIDVAALFAVLD